MISNAGGTFGAEISIHALNISSLVFTAHRYVSFVCLAVRPVRSNCEIGIILPQPATTRDRSYLDPNFFPHWGQCGMVSKRNPWTSGTLIMVELFNFELKNNTPNYCPISSISEA
jgi:hypothetical protein